MVNSEVGCLLATPTWGSPRLRVHLASVGVARFRSRLADSKIAWIRGSPCMTPSISKAARIKGRLAQLDVAWIRCHLARLRGRPDQRPPRPRQRGIARVRCRLARVDETSPGSYVASPVSKLAPIGVARLKYRLARPGDLPDQGPPRPTRRSPPQGPPRLRL